VKKDGANSEQKLLRWVEKECDLGDGNQKSALLPQVWKGGSLPGGEEQFGSAK